jgi:hypothetical protein
MLTIIKILSVISLWGVVASVVWLVDPEIIKDVLIPNSYLPMIFLVGIASSYTAYQWIEGWKLVVVTVFVMVLVGMLLLL